MDPFNSPFKIFISTKGVFSLLLKPPADNRCYFGSPTLSLGLILPLELMQALIRLVIDSFIFAKNSTIIRRGFFFSNPIGHPSFGASEGLKFHAFGHVSELQVYQNGYSTSSTLITTD